MMKASKVFVMTLVAAWIACGSAWAGQTWLCSVSSAVAVDEDGTVGPPELGDRERPTFFRVDATKKELTLLAPASRRGEVTKLETAHAAEGTHVFTGIRYVDGDVVATWKTHSSRRVAGLTDITKTAPDLAEALEQAGLISTTTIRTLRASKRKGTT